MSDASGFPPDVTERLERQAHRVANDPQREQRIARLRELIESEEMGLGDRARGMTVPKPVIRVPNPVFEVVVERRARQLCARAEPHEVTERCHVHESEARRQLVDQSQDQCHEESRL